MPEPVADAPRTGVELSKPQTQTIWNKSTLVVHWKVAEKSRKYAFQELYLRGTH
jgi:hypothetical protein